MEETNTEEPNIIRNAKRLNKLRSLFPPYFASIVDILITILHQPTEYWNGSLEMANEGNPIGAALMANSRAGLFIISALWLIVIGILGYALPQKLSKTFLLFVVIAHSFGAGTWIFSRYGFWWVMALMLFNAILYVSVEELNRSKGGKIG